MNKPWFTLVLAFVSGLFYFLAFAPYNYWPLICLSLVGLVYSVARAASAKQCFNYVFLWGLAAFFPGFQWVHVSVVEHSSTPAFFAWILVALLAAVIALVPATIFGLWFRYKNSHRLLQQTLLVIPLLWLIAELVRSWIFTGFPWLLAGSALLASPLEAWLPISSVYGTGFILMAFVCCVLLVIQRKQLTQAIIAMLLLISASILVSLPTWVEETGQVKTVSLVQGNVPQERKWLPEERWPTVDKYYDLTASEWGRDIVVWPEAAIPILKHHLQQAGVYQEYMRLVQESGTTLVLGLLQPAYESGRYYNGIYAINGSAKRAKQAVETSYFKRRLVIFGEYVPLESMLRGIIELLNLPMSTIVPGVENQNWLQANGSNVAAALCYEIAYPFLVRNNLVKGESSAEILLTLSNDAWFGNSIGPKQHAQIAQVRAKELGRPIIRSTNTGVTLIADHNGRVTAVLPQFTTEVLRGEVVLVHGMTPWAKWGSLLLWLTVLGWSCFLSLSYRIGKYNVRANLNKG